MTTNTATVEVTTPAEGEIVFPVITDQTCFSCGDGAVRATHVAVRGDTDMYFCRSHADSGKGKLIAIGFSINPEDTRPYNLR